MLRTSYQYVFFVCLVFHNVAFTIPKPEEKKDRVVEKVLSDKEHYENREHNKEYDHEAFLGDDAKTFDQLSPEESKERLSIIVDKIDMNRDGTITLEELKEWIHYVQNKYLVTDVDNQWKTHTADGGDKISWNNYIKIVYGFSNDDEANTLDKEDNETGGYSYKNMLKRDRRRWTMADVDGDNLLTKDEFAAFLHPEEIDRMKDIVVVETIEDIDKDNDGKISLQEYIGDMYNGNSEEGEEMPEWVLNEKQQFISYRDKDSDGFMDSQEVRQWLLPPGFDHADAEARHLIYETDSDADQKLTKEEILNKYDLFVGSQATDFGEALVRHDEF